jgi:hypothetical protein
MAWIVEEIKEKLETDQAWVERGVLAIYERQTATEQEVGDTVQRNGVGFSGAHGGYGSYVAEWLLSGKHLSGDHLVKTREMMSHYAGQLTRIANGED